MLVGRYGVGYDGLQLKAGQYADYLGRPDQFLADWEREHLEALQALYHGVRQDFWAESSFSPF